MKIKLTLYALGFAFAARATTLINSSVQSKYNFLSDTLNILSNYTLRKALIDFPWLEYEAIRSVLVSPLIETLIMSAIAKVSLRFSSNIILPYAIILLLAYFAHGSGIKGVNAAIAFFWFFSTYFIALKKTSHSHLQAIFFSWLSHVIYNFNSLLVQNVYILSSRA